MRAFSGDAGWRTNGGADVSDGYLKYLGSDTRHCFQGGSAISLLLTFVVTAEFVISRFVGVALTYHFFFVPHSQSHGNQRSMVSYGCPPDLQLSRS